MNNRYLIFFITFFFHYALGAQIIAPDTVCTEEIFNLELEGTPASSYCVIANTDFFFQGINVEVVAEFQTESFPLFSHSVVDGDNHYVFTSVSTNGDIVRSDFGDSFSNTPDNNLLTLDEIPNGQEGIQVVKDGDHWWGFIIGGNIDFFGPEYLVRLDFGNSLTNTPTVENLGNLGELKFPHDLFIVKEDETWIGLTVNRTGNTITRLEFGNSLGNTPTGTNLGNVGELNNPTGFFPVEVDGAWHLFVANTIGNSLSRIDFGNSLLNNPTGVNLGGAGVLNKPRDIVISKVCENYFGIIGNRTDGEIIVFGLGVDITSNFFSILTESFQGVAYPHAFTALRVTDSGVSGFVVDVETSKLSRVDFSTPTDVVNCSSSLAELDISYAEAGSYMLQLIIDEGLPSQNSYCKNIVVIPSPELDIGSDTLSCLGETLLLNSDFPETIWQDQWEGITYEVSQSGIVYASAIEGRCVTVDSVRIEFEDCETCFLSPNVFAPDGGPENDRFSPILNCDAKLLDYELMIYNRWGEIVFRADDVASAWDGRIGNQTCVRDVYAWRLLFSYEINNKVIEKVEFGDVTLIR